MKFFDNIVIYIAGLSFSQCIAAFGLSDITSAFKTIGNVVLDNTYCNVRECCTKNEIPGDVASMCLILLFKFQY